jgi:hypothetical protein
LKTKTFDVTVTDVPAVPWTGVAAFPLLKRLESEVTMDKKQLRQKLIDAGLEEKEVDARLDSLTMEALKEFDGIPEAEVLKELSKPASESLDTFVLDASVMKEFSNIVHTEVEKSLDGLEIDIEDSEQFKEYSATLATVVKQQEEILVMLKELKATTVTKEQDDDEETPRRFRILRKEASMDKKTGEEDPEETDEEMPEGDSETAKKKKLPPWLKKDMEVEADDGAVIAGSDGSRFKSMSEFALGGKDE